MFSFAEAYMLVPINTRGCSYRVNLFNCIIHCISKHLHATIHYKKLPCSYSYSKPMEMWNASFFFFMSKSGNIQYTFTKTIVFQLKSAVIHVTMGTIKFLWIGIHKELIDVNWFWGEAMLCYFVKNRSLYNNVYIFPVGAMEVESHRSWKWVENWTLLAIYIIVKEACHSRLTNIFIYISKTVWQIWLSWLPQSFDMVLA